MYYKLNEDKSISEVLDVVYWGKNMEKRWQVKKEVDNILVSTVFLGIDHNWNEGPPILFETMIFGGEHDQYQERCATYEEALEMHKVACELVWPTPQL